MTKMSASIVVAALLCLTFGAPATADRVRGASGTKGTFEEQAATPKVKPTSVSKLAQRKRAALQQRVLLQQDAMQRYSGSVEKNLDRLRRQQAETLRAQQYGQRYYQRRIPPPDLPQRQSDPIGQRLDALRQQQADTLRDQQRIGAQQGYETQNAIRRLRN